MQKGFNGKNNFNEYTTANGAKLKTGKIPKYTIASVVENFAVCIKNYDKKIQGLVKRFDDIIREGRIQVVKERYKSNCDFIDSLPKGFLPNMSSKTISSGVTESDKRLKEGSWKKYSISSTCKLVVPECLEYFKVPEIHRYEELKKVKSHSKEDSKKFEDFCKTSKYAELVQDVNNFFKTIKSIKTALIDEALSAKTFSKWVQVRPEIELYFTEGCYKEEVVKLPASASKVDAMLAELKL